MNNRLISTTDIWTAVFEVSFTNVSEIKLKKKEHLLYYVEFKQIKILL